MAFLAKTQDYLFKEIADARVYDWPLMSSPWKILCIVGLYLYAIYVYMPSYMANRKPFVLKEILIAYNVFEIVSNSVIVYGIATSGWTTHYRFFCPAVDYSEDAMSLRMARFVWWTHILKVIDLLETIFFSLRKKTNQISILHVYHHVSTVISTWIISKYYAGGLATLPLMVNCFVHVLMYKYYLLSSFGPITQNKLSIVKSRLTFIQMVQLVFIMLYFAQSILPNCQYTKWCGFIMVPYVFLNFLGFINFYVNSYIKMKTV